MLDLVLTNVLYYIYSECGDGFKVIEKNDFEEFLQSKLQKQKYSLQKALKTLNNLAYIQIKYSDENKLCLCITQLGKQQIEEEKIETQSNKKIKAEIVYFVIIMGIVAFIASFLGTLLCSFIFYNYVR